MARKKRADDGGSGGSEWLNTYADMVTLLLTFFIMLYSMSSLDSAKFNMLVKAFASGVSSDQVIIFQTGNDANSDGRFAGAEIDEQLQMEDLDLEKVFQMLYEYVQENNLQNSVNVSQGEGYVFIQFMDNMLFEPNSPNLKAEHLEILNFVGMGIKAIQDQVQLIRIDGHTAAIPEMEDYPVSDRKLSSDRANAVLMHFEDNIGIDPSKLVQMGYGKQVPIADNGDPQERSKNRRVEILISTENIIREELNSIYENLVE